jgi:hypothetical protein
VEEVERAVLALCALEPFPLFVSRVEAWAREVSTEVAWEVWRFAGLLAARELWIRAAAGQKLSALTEPASLLARAVQQTKSLPELSALALQALRVVTAHLPREGVSHAEEAEVWCSLAQTVALQPEVRPWVVRAVSELRFSGAALPRALRLYEALLAQAPDAALWARALLAWDEDNPESFRAPEWLREGLRQVVEQQSSALLAWFRVAEPSERIDLIEGMAFTCDPGPVESWLDASWEDAGEELRPVLSDALTILLDRTRDKSARRQMEQILRGTKNPAEAVRLLMQEGDILEKAETLIKLSPEGLRLWRRFGPRAFTYRPDLLREALRQASSELEAWDVASRYLAAHPGDVAHIETMQALHGGRWKKLANRALEHWLERRSKNVQALAEAAVACEKASTPCEYLHPVLEAFLLELAAQPSTPPTAAVRQAQVVARVHGLRVRKRRAPRKKKQGTQAPKERAPRAKRKARAKAPSGEETRREAEPQGAASPAETKERS